MIHAVRHDFIDNREEGIVLLEPTAVADNRPIRRSVVDGNEARHRFSTPSNQYRLAPEGDAPEQIGKPPFRVRHADGRPSLAHGGHYSLYDL